MKNLWNEMGGSRTDTLIKLVLVFFLSLLSCSVGTFVGKQFSDSQHRISDLENEDTNRSTASIPAEVVKPEANTAISEEEISKISDEFVKKEKADGTATAGEANVGTEAKKTEVIPPKKTATVHDEIADVSKRLAQGAKVEAPVAKKTENRLPTSLPKELANSTLGKFTVQLSSHVNEDDAKAKTQEYRDKGYSAFYVPAPINGKTWYRVSVGQFASLKEAKDYRAKIIADGTIPSAIVQKISQ